MNGLFGTKAILQTDINLLLQIVVVAILLIGYLLKRRKQIKEHGAIMGIATAKHVTSFLAIMGPVFFSNLDFFYAEFDSALVISMLIHAFTGAVVLALALGLVIAWAIHVSNIGPCYKRKRIMEITIGLWIASAIFGGITYMLAYL